MDNGSFRTKLTHQGDSLAELDSVRVFAAVAELKNFRGAAKALGVPRSTVSRRLAQLEARLGTRLLQRTTRQVSLTDAGESYFAQVAPALAAISDAQRSLADSQATPRGLLRVTAPPNLAEFALSQVLTGFLTEHRDVRLALELTDRFVDLVGEGFDVAFRAGPLPDSTLVARALSSGAGRHYASPAYVKARGRPRGPADLANHDCLVFSGSQRGARWAFGIGKKRVEVSVRGPLVVNSMVLARDAAVAGLGIVRLPEQLAQQARDDGQLVEVLADYPTAQIPLHLVYPSAKNLSPKVRAFVDYVTTHLKMPGSRGT